MNTCNQVLAAANKVTMIRRLKSKKSVSVSNKKCQAVASVGHQTNNLEQPIQSETYLEVPNFMNSYRLESKNSFNCSLVHKVLEEVVQKHCNGINYDSIQCITQVKTIAAEVLRRVKNLQFDRYRLIVYVQIGENKGQEIEAVVRFLWDSLKDKFVTYTLTSSSMFTTATCFGIYLD